MRPCPSEPAASLPPLPPWAAYHDPSRKWITVREFSFLYRRSERWGQHMCETGAIYDFGFATYRTETGRWWVLVPNSCLPTPESTESALVHS